MSDDRPSIAELKASMDAADPAPWYSSTSRYQSDCVFTGGPDAAVNGDARVVVQANPNFPYRGNLDGIVAMRNAAPVLLEIAAAALALKQAGIEGDEVIRLMNAATTADEYSAACALAPRVEEKRRDALRALDVALSKVRP